MNFPERSRTQVKHVISDATLWAYLDQSLSAEERLHVESIMMDDNKVYERFESIQVDHDIIVQNIPSGPLGEDRRSMLISEIESNVGHFFTESTSVKLQNSWNKFKKKFF